MNISKLKDIVKLKKKLRDELQREPHTKTELTAEEMQYCEMDIMTVNTMNRSDAFDSIGNRGYT